MKKLNNSILTLSLLMWCGTNVLNAQERVYRQTTNIPENITIPEKVQTSIGELNFKDGVPSLETSRLVYENLDKMRGVDAFLKCIPAASLRQLIKGVEEVGANAYNRIPITEELMDSKPLFLTANTSTIYAFPFLNLTATGPLVLDIPSGMLGAFNDAWFRYIADIGPMGQDKGNGGKFLLIPPDYKGELPKGYFYVHSPSYRVAVLMRASITDGLENVVNKIKKQLRIYPLSEKENPVKMEFVNISGKEMNTIHANNIEFYYHVNEVIQEEPYELIDKETRGLLASIGIEKGKEFNPNDRMKKILSEAASIGNATARSIVWYPRTNLNMKGIQGYEDTGSSWLMGWVDRNVFYDGKDGMTMNTDARVMFHYPYTYVTPAMAAHVPGKGSDYLIAYLDSDKQPMDGNKTYRIHLPANPPARNFWEVTIYDTQTRSMLQTDQKFSGIGSLSKNIKYNKDGSCDIYISPKAPKGFENNWLQSIPGKSWFVALRIYGPEPAWINKTWRPSEVELQPMAHHIISE